MKDDNNILQKRINECKLSGHKEPTWVEYRVNENSRPSDVVRGLCSYCHQIIERPLTPEEKRKISNYFCNISPEVIAHNPEIY